MSNNFGYALAVEKLMGISPPERAEYIRVMMAELTRIINHLALFGFLMNDFGAYFTPFLYAFEERELILDVFEAVSGSRMMCNYFRFGGVARDLPAGIIEKIKDLVFDRLPRKIDDLDLYITNNEVVRHRSEGVGVLTPEQAIGYSAVGPILRASGVPYDLRCASALRYLQPLRFRCRRPLPWRCIRPLPVRLDEMYQSLHILQQVVKDIPDEPHPGRQTQYQVRVPQAKFGCVKVPRVS
jgi:NADH-quinone oxidoreductase subunit D/NADH-quinone oxidoreductase subunit C/D